MGRGPRYRVPLRRRREGKTNYYRRFRLVKSGKPRMAVRISNEYLWVQFLEARIEGDRVIAAAHSRELIKKFGWKGDGNNTCAAYLTGYLAGLRALEKGVREAVLDVGLHKPAKGSRVFAALKGALDAGVEIPHSDEILPGDERVRCEHIARWAEALKEENAELYQRQFSRYLDRGLNPEELPGHVEEVKKAIEEAYKHVAEETAAEGEEVEVKA
ncbi:50S ribosomal protein L18 [Aeropyrum pernix]|uniref:Large ribosomal subunit protein uL18 n=1 Tax=Aeropyrum pernix TaxID=56636 RepID=A0A401HBC3_AERPX|nr:50S ribosomal protein L18 [Aeropyrum pernix]GBF09680.1 50S ribosomal protein L18 [Aeropyrum pernix]